MGSDVASELEIRNLVAAYSDAVNRRARDEWAATWARDATWQLMGHATEGRDAIVSLWDTLMAGFPFVMQLVHSGTVEVDGDTARGRYYLTEIAKGKDGAGVSNVGVYHDHYGREDGRWVFTCRQFDLLYMGPPDLSGKTLPFPSDF